MSEADPTRKRGIGSERLVTEDAEPFKKTKWTPATQILPGQRMEGKEAPIANKFNNPDGSYKIVFEDGDTINALDRDDGLEIVQEP